MRCGGKELADEPSFPHACLAREGREHRFASLEPQGTFWLQDMFGAKCVTTVVEYASNGRRLAGGFPMQYRPILAIPHALLAASPKPPQQPSEKR
jgi:hypothetical protein